MKGSFVEKAIKKEKKILRSMQASQDGQGIALEGCGF